jgi:hypothetical protein
LLDIRRVFSSRRSFLHTSSLDDRLVAVIDRLFRSDHRAFVPLTVKEILEEHIAKKLV